MKYVTLKQMLDYFYLFTFMLIFVVYLIENFYLWHICYNFKQFNILFYKQCSKEKNIFVQDLDTRWNSTYLMLERLKKLKTGVRYYVANYKNAQDSIITAKEWQLVNQIILLLKPFFL